MKIENETKLEFSQKTELILPKKRVAISIYPESLIRVKKMIKHYQGAIHWSWFIFSIIITIFISTFVSYFGLKNTIYGIGFLISFIASGCASIISGGFAGYLTAKEKNSKTEIIEEIDNLLESSDENKGTESLLYTFPDWIGAKETQNNQGVNYKYINLENNTLKYLSMTIQSKSIYWRAGIKLSYPTEGSEPVPELRTNNSFLYHIGANKDGSVILYIYHGKNPAVVKKALDVDNSKNPILLKIIIEDNQIKCYANNEFQYDFKYNKELLKRVYLVTWGDGKPYEVNLKEIIYDYK